MSQTTQDFVSRMDVTALTDVSGSEMMQLINAALTAANKGLVIETTDTAEDTPDVPNPDVEFEGVTPTHWKRYIWVRKPFAGSAIIVKIYVWNENLASDPIFLKWDWDGRHAAAAQVTADVANTRAISALTEANAASASAAAASASASAAQDTANNSEEGVELANSQIEATNQVVVTQGVRIAALENPSSPLPISKGGTGGGSLSAAVNNLSLGYTPRSQYFISERYGTGINAPNSTAGAYTKRQLNSISGVEPANMQGVCTLTADNTIVLFPGRWTIDFSFPANGINGGYHQARLVKDSDNSLLLEGTTEFVANNAAATRSIVKGYILLSETTTVKFVHKTTNILSFGVAGSLGDLEVYATGVIGWLTNS